MADAEADRVPDSGGFSVSAPAAKKVSGVLRQEEGSSEERLLPAAGSGDALLAVAAARDFLRFLKFVAEISVLAESLELSPSVCNMLVTTQVVVEEERHPRFVGFSHR